MRTTLKDIQVRLDHLNEIIKPQGIKVELEQRYSYKAFDLYKLNGDCVSTLEAGLTSKRAYDYINTLIKGIELYTWKI